MAATAQTPAPQAVTRSAVSTNPNISAIGDFRVSWTNPGPRHVDAEMHETELALQSVVDPYARADFFLSLSRDPDTHKFALDLEEGYLTTTDLPLGLEAKAGKFRSAFGKLNGIHPHALAFIDVPAVYARYLGEEGLNDEGLSLSWLVPNPLDFYQELTLQVTRCAVEEGSFAKSDADRLLYAGHLKNFWDLTDNATLELGLSGAVGPNDLGYATELGGLDLTYKWKPLQYNTYQSFVLQLEGIFSRRKIDAGADVRSWGAYVLATYQIGQRYFLTGRWDYSNAPDDAHFIERAYVLCIGWYATEFQKVELEARNAVFPGGGKQETVLLRSIFVIGAHGAHAY